MVSLLQGGVTDIRIAGARRFGERNARVAGPHSTGVYSVVGPFQVDRFFAALMTVVVARTDFPNPATDLVSVRHILAQPWRYESMLLAVRERRDAIAVKDLELTRIVAKGMPDMYGVVHGCHRAFAARDAGVDLIPATIVSEYRCDFDAFCIEGSVLIRESAEGRHPVSPEEPWGEPVTPDRAIVPTELMYPLQGLGMRVFPPTNERLATAGLNELMRQMLSDRGKGI